jgi:Uncharacterized protein conserved in bacteria
MTKQPIQKTKEQALQQLMDRCAKAEVCVSDAQRLMMRWQVPPEERQSVIDTLIRERFIDEERYAEAFVRDKLNFSRWGARKISEALYLKRIPAEIIKQAMEQAQDVEMSDRLATDLRRKNNSIKDEDPYKRKEKLLRFGMSRGYDYETVMETIECILRPEE